MFLLLIATDGIEHEKENLKKLSKSSEFFAVAASTSRCRLF
jgi:hypothetical protein